MTGAFGYLGLSLLERLSRFTRAVAVGHPPRLATPIPANCQVLHGDMTRAEEVLLPGAALVHLAGGGGGEPACRNDPALAARAIALGTSRVVAAARAAGVTRSVMASTIAVYGTYRGAGRPFVESDPIEPDDLYGSLKAAAEHVFVEHGGGVALRFANLYGGVRQRSAGAAERFARAAAEGGELTVFGDGSQRIDYLHVEDAAEAIVRALEAPAPPPAVNVGGGAPVSILELAEECVRAAWKLGARPRIVLKPAPEGKVWPDRSLAIGLAREALGWRPRVPLEEGVKELVGRLRRSVA